VIEKKGGRPAGDEFQNGENTPTPPFFVSVASKGFSSAVSLLFATLARRSISVVAKGLMEAKCWRGSNDLGWEGFGEVRRTAWPIEALGKRAGMAYQGGEESCRPNEAIIAYRYRMSRITLSGLFAAG